MEENVPEWLNDQFLADVLKQVQNDLRVKVDSYGVEPVVAPGNNYLSHLYRVRVQYKTRDQTSKGTTLIVKVPSVPKFLEDISESSFNDREPIIYNKILPKIQKVTCCQFGPESFKCPVKNVLVMNDLKEEDYIVSDKTKQLNFVQCKSAVMKIAQFHAASVVCFDKEKELIGYTNSEDLFYSERSSIDRFVKLGLKNFLKAVTADREHTRLAEYIRDRFDQIWPNCVKLTKPKLNGGFNVLNHGDLWTNNILFRYKDCGEIENVKLVDFQHTCFASPVNDLLFFIWSSGDEEVRSKRQAELMLRYLETLNDTLTSLGSGKRYSEQELREDLAGGLDQVLFVLAHLLPLHLACVEDVPDFENFTEEDYKNEDYYKHYKGDTYTRALPAYFQQLTEFFLDGEGYIWKS